MYIRYVRLKKSLKLYSTTSTDSFKHQGILIKIYLTMFLAATVAVMPSKVGTDSAPQMLIYYPL